MCLYKVSDLHATFQHAHTHCLSKYWHGFVSIVQVLLTITNDKIKNANGSTMLPCIQTPSNFKFQYLYGVLVDSLALDRSIRCNAHGSNNMGTQINQVQAPKLQITPFQNFNIDARILETFVVIKNEFVPSPKSGRNV